MSREIKFRGMTFNGKWVTGDLNQLQTSTFIHWNNNGMRTADEVNIKTVGQFTGLHDKNGVEIYENDKVFDGKYYGIIEYRECSFVINWEIDCSHDDDLNYWNDKIEVIGNIHERSESDV